MVRASSCPRSQTIEREPHPQDWRPNAGPQQRFLQLKCFEAMYGGAAGGGKSSALLVDAVRYVGRGHGRNYRALLLRRSFPELKRTLIERSHELYPRLNGVWRESDKLWRFPAGEVVEFGHLESEKDRFNYQGAEFQFIGFDELTSFTRKQYTYMISRLRSAHGIPLRIRSATNPGNEGHDWVFERFAPWLDPEYPDRAAPGEVRYFTLGEEGEQPCPKGTPGARGRAFVPALLSDNPFLANDGEYSRNLKELGPVEQAQLERGDWLVRPAAGLFFKRSWVVDKIIAAEAVPREARRIRFWDRAATKKTTSNNPAWTVGSRVSVLGHNIYVEHVKRFRESPGEVQATIKSIAETDGPTTTIGLTRDPGQAGVYEFDSYVKALRGYRVVPLIESGDKVTRFGPFSTQTQAGNVFFVHGEWLAELFDELERFPDGTFKDQADSLSGAYSLLVGKHNAMIHALRSTL